MMLKAVLFKLFLLTITVVHGQKEIPSAPSIKVKESPIETVEICFCESEAQFPGGRSAMISFFQREFQMTSIEGLESAKQYKVSVKFVVRENGSIENIEVLRFPDGLRSDQIIAILQRMPKWEPYQECGVNLPVRVRIPIEIEVY